MLSKSILKYIQSLHQKKFRDEHNVFIAEGVKVVSDLLQSGKFSCKIICAVDDFYTDHATFLQDIHSENKVIISTIELEKISLLHTPNKVLAVFYKKKSEEIILENTISIMLDDTKDPGNMGTILRIADWFGIKNIICSDACVEVYNPKVVQASMGSIARVNVIYTDLEKFVNKINGIKMYAATLKGSLLHSYQPITEGILVIGNESQGINERLLHAVTDQITIPRFGGAESLNAAVATGIILSHLVGSR